MQDTELTSVNVVLENKVREALYAWKQRNKRVEKLDDVKYYENKHFDSAPYDKET